MSFWTDLIWLGNTLLPRWIVFGAPIALVLGFALILSAFDNREG